MQRALLILIILLSTNALARDDGRFAQSDPETKAWFNKLANKKGYLCCSDADGYAISDVDWESTKNGNFRVKINEKWFDVPDDSVVIVPNRVGRAMVWPIKTGPGPDDIFIRCFMPGALT